MMTKTVNAAKAAITQAGDNLARIETRQAETVLALADAERRRADVAFSAVLGDAQAEAERLSAIADHVSATALMADIAMARAAAHQALADANTKFEMVCRQDFETAFKSRLDRVLMDHPDLSKGPADKDFIQQVLIAYRWMAGLYRLAEPDRSKYLTFWLDQFDDWRRKQRFSASVRPAHLLAAAFAHGDVPVEDGGMNYNRFLGLHLYSGRAARSVPLNGAPQELIVSDHLEQAEEREPVVIRVRGPEGPLYVNFGARQ